MFEGFIRHQVRIGDISINCVVGGEGPPVLLLHGYPQCLAMWARVAPSLAQSFTIVCADLRGYGDSSKPQCLDDSSNYSFRAMANDQLALMQHFGFGRFHVIGHDRGGRTAHRMTLDHPDIILSMAVLDIAPTYSMFMEINHDIARAYWHWYFLQQPYPFPEKVIAADADFFYETCLVGWGATRLEDFDPAQLAEYRRCWRDPRAIHGSCSDYRAAATVDLNLDAADIEHTIECPTLALWGSQGLMHRLFDLKAQWQRRCSNLKVATLPGGHFFVDQFPEDTARTLESFLLERTPRGMEMYTIPG